MIDSCHLYVLALLQNQEGKYGRSNPASARTNRGLS